MINQTYINFIEKFEYLTPYELNHFCAILHHHYKLTLQQEQTNKGMITPADFKEILINSMQATQLELAEQKVKDAELNLQMLRAKIYIK